MSSYAEKLIELRATIDWFSDRIAKEDDADEKADLKKKRKTLEKELETAAKAKVQVAEQKHDTGNNSPQQRERYTHVKRIETALPAKNVPQFDGNDPAETESFLERL